MSDYSAVAPPPQQPQQQQQPNQQQAQSQQQQSGQFNQSAAFAAALQRAKQVAAKIQPGTTPPAPGDGRPNKRPLDDGCEPEAKKATVNPLSGGLATARPMPPIVGPGIGPQMNEDIKVPDKMVGLIIGRGGEQITRLQAESGCKIQMAPDSQGMPDRICSLSGTKDAIARAKDLIMGIVHLRGKTEGFDGGAMPNSIGGGHAANNFNAPGMTNNHGMAHGGGGMGGPPSSGNNRNFIEIMLPGAKVGLVIGKGGETIKQLQEKSGAKMIVIQDGPAHEQEKPLRISGEPMKVEYAKKLVYELLAEKEMQSFNRRPPQQQQQQQGPPQFGGDGYGGGGGTTEDEVVVPQQAVGVVIGKGGDMIKKLQMETGAKVQFQQLRDEVPGDRRCYLAGTPKQVEMARQKIEELIDSVHRRDTDGGGMMMRGGRGRNDRFDGGRGPRNGGGQDFGGGWNGQNRQQAQQEVTFVVPSGKCGVIIGRGGETIKQINQQSGAHCELDRRVQAPPNATEKTFVIRGDPERIEAAKRIISEKIQLPLNFMITGGGGGGGGGPVPNSLPTAYPGMAPQGYNPQGWGMPAGGGGVAAYQQPQWNTGGGDVQATPQQPQAQPNAMQVNPNTGQPDYSLQWAEYYRSLGMHREAEMIEQQAKTKGLQAVQQAPPTPTQAAPATNGTAQQTDYSAQWAEYYRSMGKIKEAEAIEAQMKNKQPQMAPQAYQQPQQQQQQPQQQQQQPYSATYQAPTGYYGGQPQGGVPQNPIPNAGGGGYGGGGYPAYGYGAPGGQAPPNANPDN